MKHYWIYELIVAHVGSYGLFDSVEAAEQELRNNSVVWDRRVPEGLANIYYNGKVEVAATLHPKAVFTQN